MDEIERKALAMINEVMPEDCLRMAMRPDEANQAITFKALCRAIEQHEAFRQEVSDAAVKATHTMAAGKLVEASGILAAFIIPKPDPLVDAWLDAFPGNHIDDAREECAKISAALAARGLEVRKIGESEDA